MKFSTFDIVYFNTYRTDQDHLDKFSHPPKRKSPASLAGVKHDQPLCRYGSGCYK